jgi:threonine synthase
VLHVSTRGEAPAISFTDALLAGLARDGGLYVPERWPALSRDAIAASPAGATPRSRKPCMGALVDGEIAAPDLGRMIAEAYAPFRHPAVAPLVQIGDNLFVLELFHGPTLAFKDVAMQLLAQLMDHVLKARGGRATIVGATSGDTGSAAVEAFTGLDQVDVFILFPHGRVSDVQRRQMTTVDAANVHAHRRRRHLRRLPGAREGDVQPRAFSRRAAALRRQLDQLGPHRRAGGLLLHAAVALGGPHRPVSFSVPTGNFGDVLAGFVAKRMGLPIERLMVATNANDILAAPSPAAVTRSAA